LTLSNEPTRPPAADPRRRLRLEREPRAGDPRHRWRVHAPWPGRRPRRPSLSQASEPHLAQAFARGLALHLTNPKAILFFASLYTLGVGPQAGPGALLIVIAAVGLQSIVIFAGYALIFAHPGVAGAYARLRRVFEAAFAIAFAAAATALLRRN
jgi:threonine efflux protein